MINSTRNCHQVLILQKCSIKYISACNIKTKMEINQQGNWTQLWVMCLEYLDDIVFIPIIPDDYGIENNPNEDLPGI